MPSKIHVSRAQIDQFTNVVRIPPERLLSPIWLEEQEQAVRNLPPPLLRPKNFATRIMERFTHDRAVLCHNHRKLNAIIVRTLFDCIQRECTYRMMPFNYHPTAPQDPDIQAWRKRMVAFNSLWMEKESFYHIHNANEEDPIHRQIKGDCEACILATIGGDPQMLADLYISSNGRGTSERRSQPIGHMVDGWLDELGMLGSTHRATKDFYRKIRVERVRMQKERRAKRRAKNIGNRPSTAPERPPRPDETPLQPAKIQEEEDAEEEKAEIIDFYARRLSTMPVKKGLGTHRNDSRLSLHPSIRCHLGYDAETGQYSRAEPEVPPMPPMPSGYGNLGRSDTLISRDSRFDPSSYERYRSDSPVSPISVDFQPNYTSQPSSVPHPRRRSREASQYSASIYSRAPDINDSGYASSIPSDRDRRHERNLAMNPTNADVGRNRMDSYCNLVGTPSAYEFECAPPQRKQKMKTLYEFEPDTDDDELEISMETEPKARSEMKADRLASRSDNRETREDPRGRSRRGEAATTDRGEERRATRWGDFYTLQEENERRDGGRGRDEMAKPQGQVKKGQGTAESKVQTHFMEAFRKGLRED